MITLREGVKKRMEYEEYIMDCYVKEYEHLSDSTPKTSLEYWQAVYAYRILSKLLEECD